MSRAIDILSVLLFGAAIAAFVFGILALADTRDVAALYWLAVGGLVLKAATDVVRPKGER